MLKKIILKPLIALLVIAFLVALFIGFLELCKWQHWLPQFTEPVLKFFNKIGITFLSKFI